MSSSVHSENGCTDLEAATATSTTTATKDAKEDGDNGTKKKPLGFHLSFVALNLMVLMVSLDATALAVATPKIANDLHGTSLEAFWATLSFLLAMVVSQPIYTSASHTLGRTGPLHSSFFFFVLGSIVLATARSMPVLIVGRVFQGIGAGGFDVLSDIILVDMTTLKERPLYLGLFAISLAGGSILGPIVGALFSEYAGWRWLGWANLPISAVGFLLVLFFLKLRPIEQSLRQKLRRLDWIGMLLFTLGCTLFASPLSWAGAMYSWSSWRTIVPLIIGAIILIVFGIYERMPSDPIFPYRIFKTTTATLSLIASFLHGAVIYSGILYLPIFFQAIWLETPLKSAISILPLCCTSVGFSLISGVYVEVARKYRWTIIASWAFAAVGCGLVALWERESSRALVSGVQVLIGIGVGPLFSVLPLPIQATVPNVDDTGIAVGTLVSFRLFGGLVGLAICSTVFTNIFGQHLPSFDSLPDSLAILVDANEAIGFLPRLMSDKPEPEMLGAVIETYRKSIIAVFLVLCGFSGLGLLVSFLIREISIEREDLGRQQFEDESTE